MKRIVLFSLSLFFVLSMSAQNQQSDDTLIFTTVKANKITSVKNQANTGTCWSFSGLALFESEVLRLKNREVDLSEMFIVRHSYEDKADKYVRTGGYTNFAQGGSFEDVWYVLKHYGIVPESEMDGLNYGTDRHQHGELSAIGTAMVQAVGKSRSLSPVWKKAFGSVMETYLGAFPEKFTVDGKEQTPLSYVKELGLNMDDYVSLTSFTHHPFYSAFALEIPDNWRWGLSYNLPLDEFMRVFDYAIDKGFTLAWASDVSEAGFTRDGFAVLPETKQELLAGTDQARWVGGATMGGKMDVNRTNIIEEKVTQESRQLGYDNKQTTDDHGMQIYGIAKDQTGKEYYMVKNSWGLTGKYEGHWYATKAFVASKTLSIMLHKDAVPKDIRKKLGI